jgi:hypothetical protein
MVKYMWVMIDVNGQPIGPFHPGERKFYNSIDEANEDYVKNLEEIGKAIPDPEVYHAFYATLARDVRLAKLEIVTQ